MSVYTTVQRSLFWILCLLVALVSYRFLVLGVEISMPVMAQHLTRPLALYGHIGAAPVALAVLPFQFWQSLRARRPGVHRWLGRIYGLAILIGGVAGLALALTTQSGTVAAWGFGVLAVVWLGVTARAVQLAMARQIAAHRRWMIRSAALTLSAVTLRLMLPIGAAAGDFATAYQVIAWACWVPNLLVAEWWIARSGKAGAVARPSDQPS